MTLTILPPLRALTSAKMGLMVVLLWVMVPFLARAQEEDKAFAQARTSAYAGNYEEARRLVRAMLLQNPRHYEGLILMARTYNWQQRYDSAAVILDSLTTAHPEFTDAQEAKLDNRFWSGNYAEALQVIQILEAVGSLTPERQLVKAEALGKSGQYDLAETLLRSRLAANPDDAAARYLLIELISTTRKKQVSANYYLQGTPGRTPWHMASVEGLYKFKAAPTAIRYSWATRFGNTGHQLEADCYPKLTRMTYLYLNAGWGNNTGVFPSLKGGVEVYSGLKKAGLEFNGGVRYMGFENVRVTLYTAEVGKYLGPFWLGIRGFYSTLQDSRAEAIVLTARYYLPDGFSNLTVTASNGTIPTLVGFYNETVARFINQRISADFSYQLSPVWQLRTGLWYENEQFQQSPDRFLNRWSGTAGVSYSF